MIWEKDWEYFKNSQPFKESPYNKRNWGNQNHSLCSFYGKLKPAIAYFLVKTFTSEGETVFDCFTGSGTIPFESALNHRRSFGMDINPISTILTTAKVKKVDLGIIQREFNDLSNFMSVFEPTQEQIETARSFGFNKTLKDYYDDQTLIEILQAREYFKLTGYNSPEKSFILSCLLHILHGNRPYALSRRSHPITPYAPSGDFQYKNVLNKLYVKLDKSYQSTHKYDITEGTVFFQDILDEWPVEIQNIDSIITSPPFFDSTKYYLSNWIRNWFLGWEFEDFEKEKNKFIDTIQKKSFNIYEPILLKCKERLKNSGVVVFHLGKSHKKDMGQCLFPIAKRFFNNVELFNEDVSMIEKHGVEDKGSVNVHQYLIMY
jgi:DNA modification methylase